MTKKEALKMLEAIERYYFNLHTKQIMNEPSQQEYDGVFEIVEDTIHSLAQNIKESTSADGDPMATLEKMIQEVQQSYQLFK